MVSYAAVSRLTMPPLLATRFGRGSGFVPWFLFGVMLATYALAAAGDVADNFGPAEPGDDPGMVPPRLGEGLDATTPTAPSPLAASSTGPSFDCGNVIIGVAPAMAAFAAEIAEPSPTAGLSRLTEAEEADGKSKPPLMEGVSTAPSVMEGAPTPPLMEGASTSTPPLMDDDSSPPLMEGTSAPPLMEGVLTDPPVVGGLPDILAEEEEEDEDEEDEDEEDEDGASPEVGPGFETDGSPLLMAEASNASALSTFDPAALIFDAALKPE